MGRTERSGTSGASAGSKVVKSAASNVIERAQPSVGKHGYTQEETEAAFFLYMGEQKLQQPGLKLSETVSGWNSLAVDTKNVILNVALRG